jgi:hypothetical protein
MLEKWILYTLIRGIGMYVYFEYTVPLKVYSEILLFKNINPCCSNYFALLLTTAKIFQRCCPQRRKIINVVAYNAEKYSNFSSCVLFCVVAYNADSFSTLWATARKNDCCCCLHSGKIIGIVANNAVKFPNLYISTKSKS